MKRRGESLGRWDVSVRCLEALVTSSSNWLTAEQIAAASNPPVTVRSVHRRAAREGWRSCHSEVRGGRQTLYHISSVGHQCAPCDVGKDTPGESQHTQSEQVPSVARSDFSLADVPDAARRDTARRLAALEAWDRYVAQAAGGRLADLTDDFCRIWNSTREQHGGIGVSRARLFAWRAAYRAKGMAGLVDGRKVAGVAAIRIKQVPDELWRPFLRYWLTPQQRTVQLAWECAIGEAPAEFRSGWAQNYGPGLFRRRVRELPASHVILAREGQKAWSDKCEQPIFRDYSSLLSNQLWVSDHHQLDMWVWDARSQKPYRPWLTVWSDVRSRKVLSWALENASPNQDRVLCTWSDAVTEHGLPDAVLIDNGKDYRARAFAGGRTQTKLRVDEEQVTSVLGELEVAVHFAIPYNARSKPVERWFGFLESRFSPLWGTYCANNPQKRSDLCKEILTERPHEAPPLDQVAEAIGGFVNWFNFSWRHSGDGMGGRTPDDVYAAHHHTHRLRPSADQLRLCLLPSEWLTCRKGCVRLTVAGVGRWYTDEAGELAMMPAETRLRARYNPRDLSRVYLFDEAGRHICDVIEQRRMPWSHTGDDLREAKAYQARRKRQAKEGLAALVDLQEQPDALQAIKQQQDGYAAAHGELIATGTDGAKRAADRPRPVIRAARSLRIVRDVPPPVEPAAPAEPRTSWMDGIPDEPTVPPADEQDGSWMDAIE
jgi:hypothetical protein